MVGIGLSTGRPAVLVTTSGTAAVEVHAAVVEAHLSRVPLIVCTADRPPELHQVGVPQTIEQAGLFVGSLRWAVDPGVPDEQARSSWRSLGSRLVAEATAGPMGPGPVHANLAFRDPLLKPRRTAPGPPQRPALHRPNPSGGFSSRARLTPSPPSLDPGRGPDRRGSGRGPPRDHPPPRRHLGLARPRRPAFGCQDPRRAGFADHRHRGCAIAGRELRRPARAGNHPAPRSAVGVEGPGRLVGVVQRRRCRAGADRSLLGLAGSPS